ncbi:MAG TPA: carboxypeptidase-like regulatory domain-containing protein [Longimicrobium sp.]|nr:carboxypeptidase-like regulatory domain-containing protein [Longimicrobium sp.]
MLLALAVALSIVPLTSRAQARADVIRGRVLTDSGTAIAGADISATRAPDRLTQQTRSGPDGTFTIRFEYGTGDYLLHATAPDRRPFVRRLTRQKDETEFEVEIRLAPLSYTLATVQVTATRPKPDRGPEFGTETGASERLADPVNGALSPDQEGDLAAIAATTPGMNLSGGGLSVLGLGPEQSNTTLNGMAFAGGDVPRDARTRVRASTSTYDPARGGFSAAQVALELGSGSAFDFRRAHVVLDARPLQAPGTFAPGLDQRFTAIEVSAGGDGPIVENKLFYNVGVQYSRRAADRLSILDAPPAAFGGIGLATDSVTRFLAVLGGSGIPALAPRAGTSKVGDEGSFIFRIDHTPYARTTWSITGYGKLAHSGALAIAPTVTPGFGGQQASSLFSLQAARSGYFGKDYLNDTRTAFSLNSVRTTPYLRLPGGQVLVASSSGEAGNGSLVWLQFGGNSAFAGRRRDWTWETVNETQWYTPGRPHRLKLTGESRLDGYSLSPQADRLGTFTFSSLADLAANRPATFTRTFGVVDHEGGEWSGALSFSDLWRPWATLQLLDGVRIEGNRFTAAPSYNPAVDAAFGARTDHAPNTLHVSPRIGFTWRYGGSRTNPYTMMTANAFGSFYRGPSGVIRGGIGEFRNLLAPALLADAAGATGLPGSTLVLRCVGAAAPTPDWAAYSADPAAVPQECTGGGAAGGLVESAPMVQLYDRGYTAARSWRGNLAWVSSFKQVIFSVEGIYSLNLNQPGIVDLNFTGAPQFRLPGEGGRPVYVGPASIDPRSGALSLAGSRRVADFGAVVNYVSDLRSVSRQLTLTAVPDLLPGRVHLSVAYTLAGTRAQARGFDGAASGDPAAVEWARGNLDARHQVLVQAGVTAKGVTLTFFGRLTSGLPYTPLVGGDVNGDGYVNDRAFVFDPSVPAAGDLAPGLSALLAAGPSRVRDCLARQVNRIVGRNSCTGPWTASTNARLSFSSQVLHLGNRVDFALNVANPLGALDHLVHAEDGLHGWGDGGLADQVLYTPRSFDAAARQFRYEVNPRFGRVPVGLGNPFRISIEAHVDLGKPLPVQQLGILLRPGRAGHPGTLLSADSLRKRYALTVPNIYDALIEQSDSLLLSRQQVGALTEASVAYRARADSAWAGLATYLDGLGDSYDAGEAMQRVEATTDAVWELAKAEGPRIREILSPLQLRLAPGLVRYVITTKDKIKIRYFFG